MAHSRAPTSSLSGGHERYGRHSHRHNFTIGSWDTSFQQREEGTAGVQSRPGIFISLCHSREMSSPLGQRRMSSFQRGST